MTPRVKYYSDDKDLEFGGVLTHSPFKPQIKKLEPVLVFWTPPRRRLKDSHGRSSSFVVLAARSVQRYERSDEGNVIYRTIFGREKQSQDAQDENIKVTSDLGAIQVLANQPGLQIGQVVRSMPAYLVEFPAFLFMHYVRQVVQMICRSEVSLSGWRWRNLAHAWSATDFNVNLDGTARL